MKDKDETIASMTTAAESRDHNIRELRSDIESLRTSKALIENELHSLKQDLGMKTGRLSTLEQELADAEPAVRLQCEYQKQLEQATEDHFERARLGKLCSPIRLYHRMLLDHVLGHGEAQYVDISSFEMGLVKAVELASSFPQLSSRSGPFLPQIQGLVESDGTSLGSVERALSLLARAHSTTCSVSVADIHELDMELASTLQNDLAMVLSCLSVFVECISERMQANEQAISFSGSVLLLHANELLWHWCIGILTAKGLPVAETLQNIELAASPLVEVLTQRMHHFSLSGEWRDLASLLLGSKNIVVVDDLRLIADAGNLVAVSHGRQMAYWRAQLLRLDFHDGELYLECPEFPLGECRSAHMVDISTNAGAWDGILEPLEELMEGDVPAGALDRRLVCTL